MLYGGRTLAPINPARSAAESAAPWAWRGLVFAYISTIGRNIASSDGQKTTDETSSDLAKLGRVNVFDGSSRIVFGDTFPVSGSQNRTILILGSANGDSQTFVTFGEDTGGGLGERYEVRTHNTGGFVRTEVAGGFKYGTTSITDGELHSVISRLNGTNATDVDHFVDGTKEGVGDSASQAINTAEVEPLRLGFRTNGIGASENFLTGDISMVLIWDHDLTDGQAKVVSEDPFVPFRRRPIRVRVAGAVNQENLSGTIASTSALSGSLDAQPALSGQIDATSALSGALDAQPALSGQIDAVSALNGALDAQPGLASTLSATSALSGDLTFAGQLTLSGTLSATSDISGAMQIDMAMTGTLAALSDLSGDITLEQTTFRATWIPQASTAGTWDRYRTALDQTFLDGQTTFLDGGDTILDYEPHVWLNQSSSAGTWSIQ